jgi:hypothetical protein
MAIEWWDSLLVVATGFVLWDCVPIGCCLYLSWCGVLCCQELELEQKREDQDEEKVPMMIEIRV